MSKTLVIIPSKDRPEAINCLLTCLQYQEGDFDIFIGDMCTNPDLYTNNWYLRNQLERLRHMGHNYMVQRVAGTNQLYGYQAGLEYAKEHGYKTCIGGDDDIIYESNWISHGQVLFEHSPDCGILVGYTLLPWQNEAEQTAPEWFLGSPDYQGKLDQLDKGGYYHCSLINPKDKFDGSIRKYEQVYGGFFFRTEDALNVGGFPTHLSPLGFRGEMMLQTAIYFSGKELWLSPALKSWHYSASFGGLKLVQGEFRQKCLEQDQESWRKFIARRKPTTEKVI